MTLLPLRGDLGEPLGSVYVFRDYAHLLRVTVALGTAGPLVALYEQGNGEAGEAGEVVVGGWDRAQGAPCAGPFGQWAAHWGRTGEQGDKGRTTRPCSGRYAPVDRPLAVAGVLGLTQKPGSGR